jgi:hypothetical protein
MPDQERWPIWTEVRVLRATAMILSGMVVGVVGWLFAFFLFTLDDRIEGMQETIGLVATAAVFGGLPASIPFFILSRLRRRPVWAWLGAVMWFIGGALLVPMRPLERNRGLALLSGLALVTAALGLTGQWTLKPAVKPDPPDSY